MRFHYAPMMGEIFDLSWIGISLAVIVVLILLHAQKNK